MMKLLSVFLVVFGFFSAQASEMDLPPGLEFAGVWEGEGYRSHSSAPGPLETSFQVIIELFPQSLRISECYLNEEVHGIYKCDSISYLIQNESTIYNERGQKIGDIYPGHIQIFNGFDQASEQYMLDLSSDGQLKYSYSLANMDIGGVFQQAFLTRK